MFFIAFEPGKNPLHNKMHFKITRNLDDTKPSHLLHPRDVNEFINVRINNKWHCKLSH